MKNSEDFKILFLNFRKEFIEIASQKLKKPFFMMPNEKFYDIIAIDENGNNVFIEGITTKYVLCPHSSPCKGKISCQSIISCGMSPQSTFGLSSTNKERSMFSVNRAICFGSEILLPFEEPFKPDERLTLYENIIIYGIIKLSSPSSYCKYCIKEKTLSNNTCNY
jgi:hypothetical protein